MKRAALIWTLLLGACHNPDSALAGAGQIVGDTIPEALTEIPGDAARGESVFAEREQGHCVLCHVVAGLNVPFQGNVGPDLSLVGERLSSAELRLRIVDYQIVTPGALMPSYYRKHDLYQVQEPYVGETILSAQQVEDLVTYLSELEENVDDIG